MRALPRHAIAALTAALLAVAACGGSSTTGAGATATKAAVAATPAATATPSATPAPLKKVTIQFGFRYAVVQHYALYDLGIAKGFFAKRGIDAKLVEGTGSTNVVQLVANGSADFGALIDTATMIRVVNQGAPLKMVGQDTAKSLVSVLSRGDNPINKPADLVGKKIGFAAGSYAAQVFPALLSANNISDSLVTIVNVDASAYATSLAQKLIDGYVSGYDTNLPTLTKLGLNPVALKFADFGVSYGPQEGLVVTQKTLDERGDTVKAVLAALDDTFRYAMANVDQAASEGAKAGVAAHPDAVQEDVAQQQLRFHIGLLKESTAAGKSPLAIDPADFEKTIGVLVKYTGLTNPKPATSYYTNAYLP